MQRLQLLRGHPQLVTAAKDAVLQYLYRPTLLNGKPTEVITDVGGELLVVRACAVKTQKAGTTGLLTQSLGLCFHGPAIGLAALEIFNAGLLEQRLSHCGQQIIRALLFP